MSTEFFLLFVAMTALTGMAAWIHAQADGAILQLFTLALISSGLLGMAGLILGAMLGWQLPTA